MSYATEYSISFNEKKTRCILVNSRGSNKAIDPPMPLFYIDDNPIEYV